MTLLIINNEIKVIEDNGYLSITMLELIKQRKITIVRFNDKISNFEKLLIDNDKLCWIRVPQAKRLVCKGAIIYQ